MIYTEVTFSFRPLLPAREIAIAELSDLGYESFVETDNGLKAYIPSSAFRAELLSEMAIHHLDETTISFEHTEIADQNWNAEWEKNFDPIIVDDTCIVRAPFHTLEKSYTYDIIIEPKMSFGTGHHATTFLMMQHMLTMNWVGKRTLDMGCGTAVLAILAEKKGATDIVAIDIDEWAFENSIENIQRNHCSHIVCHLGGAEKIVGPFDVIIANINRNILMNDAATYAAALRSGGELLLSGFYASDVDTLLTAFPEFEVIGQHSKGEWTMLSLKKS